MLSKLCVNPEDPEEEEEHRPWRKKLSLSIMALNFTWVSVFKFAFLLLLVAAIGTACYTLPTEKILKDFLYWIENDLGPWGPVVLAIAYIPLTVLAVPASVLTLGGGYLFGLPLGFAADSTGAAIGATAAFLVGRTIGRSYVLSKLKDYPKFQAVAIAVQKSGFKIVLLLRLVPLLPFNMLNYLLSVTPVPVGEYMLASWLGMMPITLVLVYIGTTLKDLSDVTHGWDGLSKIRWVYVVLGLVVSGKFSIKTRGVTIRSESSIYLSSRATPENSDARTRLEIARAGKKMLDRFDNMLIMLEFDSIMLDKNRALSNSNSSSSSSEK